jgi:type IV pilus assembly protein PilB
MADRFDDEWYERGAMLAIAARYGLLFVDLDDEPIDPVAVNVVPSHIAQRHNLMPIQERGRVLTVATSYPGDLFAQDDVYLASHLEVQWVVATPTAIRRARARYYRDS